VIPVIGQIVSHSILLFCGGLFVTIETLKIIYAIQYVITCSKC
jgi:hypothetical protein